MSDHPFDSPMKNPDQLPVEPKKIGNLRLIRNRIIAGLFVLLPIFVTYIVIKWLYDTIGTVMINPVRDLLLQIWGLDENNVFISSAAFLVAFGMIVGVLFICGMFFRSRLHRFVDWVLYKVPGVNSIYKAVSNVVEAISQTQEQDENKFKRVVLIKFPHPGCKVPAFVTSECRDISTGKNILCIYVPTTPIPTSGYMLLIPEEEVTPVNWDLQETLQAIVSGGITVPRTVDYFAKGDENPGLETSQSNGSPTVPSEQKAIPKESDSTSEGRVAEA